MKASSLLFLGILVVALSTGCRKDNGTRLFTMNYTNFEFEIPAGYSSIESMIFEFPLVNSSFESYLDQNGYEANEIDGIYPISASIQSFDGKEYYFIQDVEIRICPVGEDCTPVLDAAFTANDLNGTAQQKINMLPGLQNFKDVLSEDRFKLVLSFKLDFGQITPYNVNSRANFSFEAVKQ